MLDAIFQGLFDSSVTTLIAPADFLLCVGVSLVIGLALCAMTLWRTQYSRSFAVTLAILPGVVCVVIMMVNGNVGTGVAVAGAFSLVRFRSVPGSAREISAIFFAMAIGLATGMGYALLLGGAPMLYTALGLGESRGPSPFRTLHITIPEDLDYVGVFDEVMARFTRKSTLTQVRSTNMGSLFKLTYELTLRDPGQEKAFLDELRLRNGNLEISLCHQETMAVSL